MSQKSNPNFFFSKIYFTHDIFLSCFLVFYINLFLDVILWNYKLLLCNKNNPKTKDYDTKNVIL
ncbi:MAG TPA: hypothetical protein DEQ02_10720 [Ruminococcaceae bacterium]|nr:hypothetical protein [Oscillospiraceae bacterium]